MRKAAQDHLGAPYGICRHPDPRQPEAKRTMTTGAVLIKDFNGTPEPGVGEGYKAHLLAQNPYA